MNAYKCDICGKYFEEAEYKRNAAKTPSTDDGRHRLELRLRPKDGSSDWNLFRGDICPDCMGYFCVGLCERGCQDDTVKMYAADYIRMCQNEMRTKTLGVPVSEEAEK